MDVRIIDHPKHENVTLKHANTCVFLQVTDDKKVVARNDPKAPFKQICVIGGDMVDGKSETLVALQVEDNYFLAPKKPKDTYKDTTLQIRSKKIEYSEIYDRKDLAINDTSRKYWFRLQYVGKLPVYESLAYKGFYISVEGNEVLTRKCSQLSPNDENYHIDPMPWTGQQPPYTEAPDVSITTSGTERKEITEEMSPEIATVTSQIPFTVTNTDIHLEVNMENETVCIDTTASNDTKSSSDDVTKVQRDSVMYEETEEDHNKVSSDPSKISSDPIKLSSDHVKFSSADDDRTNKDTVETDEIIEEDIQITQTKANAVKSQFGSISSDVTAGCEADDRTEDMAATSECTIGQEETYIKEKDKMTEKNPSLINERGAVRSSFWSKMFSCVSSRNTVSD